LSGPTPTAVLDYEFRFTGSEEPLYITVRTDRDTHGRNADGFYFALQAEPRVTEEITIVAKELRYWRVTERTVIGVDHE
jgi:hypothetical protein